jgi:hypothetical protein
MKSKASKVLEVLHTSPLKDEPKAIKFSDLPEPIQKAVGFISKDVTGVTSTLGTYNIKTGLTDLSTSLLSNLSSLGKRLSKVTAEDNKLVLVLKKN